MIPPIGANVTVVYRPTDAPPEIHFGRVAQHGKYGFYVEARDGRIFVDCDPAGEGVEWCRDWFGAKVKALKVVAALG